MADPNTKAGWIIIEDLNSRHPLLYAIARPDSNPATALEVPLDVLTSGHLSLNPLAIRKTDCPTLARKLERSADRLCRSR